MQNFGTYLHNPSPCDGTATILATGLGRSGTTMVSRTLSRLGLFMGTRLTPMSNEDKDFQEAIKTKDKARLMRLCRDRDVDHEKWGFKCPAARYNLAGLTDMMRSPRVIVTFRDPLATSLRNAMSMKADPLDGARMAAEDSLQLIERTAALKCPALLISYEKALQFPEKTVSAIAEFCGLPAEIDASSVIKNGDPVYLRGRL